MKKYEPMCGETVSETAKRMVELATRTGETVKAKFNDITLTAKPSTKAETITKYYSKEGDRRHKAYINSPRYKEQQRKAREALDLHNRNLKAELATAPAKMMFRNEKGWNESVAKNTDDYGSGVMRFADRWARLMEGRMAKGEKLADCAEKMSSLADNEGITGFMYGCAVSILSQVWVHGEELRKWHNLKTQIGKEGEKANENGGVLNPALLCVGWMTGLPE